jgi:hypothetical protein
VCAASTRSRAAPTSAARLPRPGLAARGGPSGARFLALPPGRMCLGCHTPENSLHFDFARYLPRILGPGHEARR